MNLDFTLEKYKVLCRVFSSLNIKTTTVAQFLRSGQPQHRQVILRHDVDRSVQSARRMAVLEAEHNIASTYYFRTTRAVFQADVIQDIYRMGHEVGYHYEVLCTARGNYQRAIQLFQKELSDFRAIAPVETISMHGSPLLPWDNRDLWQRYDFHSYGILGEAYLSIDYKNIYYFTDTGRSWNADRYNIRDRVQTQPAPISIRTTDELIMFLENAPDRPCLINTHPNRWASNVLSWSANLITDVCVNQAKVCANYFFHAIRLVNKAI